MKVILQVGVKIIFKDKEGRILLLKRSLKKYPDIKGRWDIPGGRIIPGISLTENLKREVKEETDLELVEEPELITAQDILRIAGKHVVRLTYTGKATGKIKLDLSENEEYKWLTIDETKELEDVDIYLKEVLIQGGIGKGE